jgi:hypothetical protein
MNRMFLQMFLGLLAFVLTVHGQSRNTGTNQFYFDIVRPNCCTIPFQEWERIAAKLKAERIPAFFGLYKVLNYKESWHTVSLQRTRAKEGSLILGPFDSEARALKALYRLPKLLPNHMANEDERRKGVEPDPFGHPQHWVIGMYQMSGFKTH